MGTFSATLAAIAAATYSDDLAELPAGFVPFSAPGIENGLFQNQNAAAAVLTGTVDGRETLVLSFRGSDDRDDWVNNLNNINADYDKFADLIATIDAYATENQLPVLVTGHSLGGALAQVFMAAHPDTGPGSYQAVVFGSPGALIEAAPDARITSYGVADDPIPYLGEFRAEIGDEADGDPLYAAEVAAIAVAVSGSLSVDDVLDAIDNFDQSYVNRGLSVVLPDSGGELGRFTLDDILSRTELINIASEDSGRHSAGVYADAVVAVEDPVTYVGGAEANNVQLWSLYQGFALGDGVDTLVTSGAREEYSVTRLGDGSFEIVDAVAERDGTDTASGAERIAFADVVVAFDVDGNAGLAYRLYGAAFGREGDEAGLTHWVGALDAGISSQAVAGSFLASAEFEARYGANPPNEAYIDLLYQNVLDREADAEGLAYWNGQITSGTGRADLLLSFSESEEYQASVIGMIEDGIDLGRDPMAVA